MRRLTGDLAHASFPSKNSQSDVILLYVAAQTISCAAQGGTKGFCDVRLPDIPSYPYSGGVIVSLELNTVVANALRLDVSAVNDDLGFGKTPEWDSLNHVTLMIALESEFNVTISDDDVVELTDLCAIRNFIRSHRPAPEAR